MPVSRRTFLRDGLRSAVSVGFLVASYRVGFGQKTRGEVRATSNVDRDIPLDAQKDPVFLFAEETFKPYVNGIFQAPNARGELIELRLIKVQGHRQTNTVTRRARESKSFTLVFKASDELPPFTSIHTISHPALGKFDLFLTKRKTDQDELLYEAVINHVQ